jgi:AcrR family transcriptional regulator
MSKKEDIINTALNLFNSHSYNSIGVDRIISESGVAKMTFYKYFPSKAKLIEECLVTRNQNLQQSLEATIAACDPSDYLSHIRAIFEWYHAWFHTRILMVVCSKRQLKKFQKFILLRYSLQLIIKNG